MRFQYLSYIIEKSAAGWWVLDWDYEDEYVVAGPYRSKHAAMNCVDAREGV